MKGRIIKIRTELGYDQKTWFAYDDDNYDGAPDANSPAGSDTTEAGAVMDLMDQIKNQDSPFASDPG